MMRFHTVLVAAIAVLCASGAQGMTGDKPEFKQITDGIYAYVGKRNEANAMAIVTTQGVVVVDTGNSPPETRNLLKNIQAVTSQPVRYLVVTQNHGDHIGGMPLLSPPATVIVHDKVARALAAMKPYQVKAWRARFPERRETLKDATPLDNVASFTSRMSLKLGGKSIELFYVDDPDNIGDVAVWLPESGVLHAGFVGYKDRHPDIRPDYSHGTTVGMIKQLEAMIALAPKVVVPGHGPLSDAGDLRTMIDYLLSARGKVRDMMAKGMGLDAIRKDFSMAEYQGWDLPDHFPLIAETIYRELRGEGPQTVNILERQVSATITGLAEAGRFLTVRTDSGEELRLRISNETYVEGISDRALLKPGMRLSALYQVPEGTNAALGYLIMEITITP